LHLAYVRGASIPYPYGGKPRVIMVDLDPEALQARGMTPADVAQAAGASKRHRAVR
jgi:multidrug efflux pump subunit AcrB